MRDNAEPLTECDNISEHMRTFFRDVAVIKGDIDAIRRATEIASNIANRHIVAASPKLEDAAASEMQKIMASTHDKISVVKAGLTSLKNSTEKKGDSLNPNEQRIRENLFLAVQKKFLNISWAYRAIQLKYADDLQSKVRRNVSVVKPDASDDFIKEVMNEEGGMEKLYQEVVLKSAAIEVTQEYERTIERFKDSKKLEESVMELSQMFLDFAVLIEEQGELIDSIEQHVAVAVSRIEDGNLQLEKGIVYQKSARKWMCCASIVIAVLAISILAFMGGFD